MIVLVAGASGATGRRLVAQLLQRGHSVRIIVRPAGFLPDVGTKRDKLSVIRASILDLDDAELARHVRGCDAVASCLGHNLSLRGILGPPYRLVTEATRRLCAAVVANEPAKPVRYVLMNTTGNRNRDLNEPVSLAQKAVIGLLRLLLPPHADNEQAADYLRTEIGPGDVAIEWVAVRPDTLIEEDAVTPYAVHPSPTRSALFDAGQTSRINVAHFMAELIDSDDTWNAWKSQMPVIYNRQATTGSSRAE